MSTRRHFYLCNSVTAVVSLIDLDQEAGTNSDIAKRQRTETLKASEHQNTNVSTIPKGMSHTSVKHAFSRSDSSLSHEEPKERIAKDCDKDAAKVWEMPN